MPHPSITYRITESDYIAALRLFRKNASKPAKAVVWFIAVLGICATAIGLYESRAWMVAGGVLYATMPWWLNKFINEPLARRNYRKYPAVQEPQTLTLGITSSDGVNAQESAEVNGVTMQSTIGDSRLQWQHIHRWADNDDYLLLYVQPRLYFIVPKRADPDNRVLGPLRKLLSQHVVGTSKPMQAQ